MRYKGILASSSNPEELSRTVQGIIIGASSLIVFVGLNIFGIQIQQADVTEFAAAIGMVIGGIATAYGLILKVVNSLGRTP